MHSLSINSTALTSQLVGILPVAGSGTYKNNMVRLGLDANGNSITPGYVIYGMFEIAGTNNLYFNSVYIGGSGVASSSNTFAFVSNVTSGTRFYEDNILWNARSNASGTATNYAIGLSRAELELPAITTTCLPMALAAVWRTGAPGCGLADWQTFSGQDANSISVDPQFINPERDRCYR